MYQGVTPVPTYASGRLQFRCERCGECQKRLNIYTKETYCIRKRDQQRRSLTHLCVCSFAVNAAVGVKRNLICRQTRPITISL
jgi:hypothetical protein